MIDVLYLYHRCAVARDSPDARLRYSSQGRTGTVLNTEGRTACPLHDHGMTEAELLDETTDIAPNIGKEKRKQMLMHYLNTKLNITTPLGTQPHFKVACYYTDDSGQNASGPGLRSGRHCLRDPCRSERRRFSVSLAMTASCASAEDEATILSRAASQPTCASASATEPSWHAHSMSCTMHTLANRMPTLSILSLSERRTVDRE